LHSPKISPPIIQGPSMRTRVSAALFAATVFAAQFLPALARADQICFERGGQFAIA
jgi:hypothetical protein